MNYIDWVFNVASAYIPGRNLMVLIYSFLMYSSNHFANILLKIMLLKNITEYNYFLENISYIILVGVATFTILWRSLVIISIVSFWSIWQNLSAKSSRLRVLSVGRIYPLNSKVCFRYWIIHVFSFLAWFWYIASFKGLASFTWVVDISTLYRL